MQNKFLTSILISNSLLLRKKTYLSGIVYIFYYILQWNVYKSRMKSFLFRVFTLFANELKEQKLIKQKWLKSSSTFIVILPSHCLLLPPLYRLKYGTASLLGSLQEGVRFGQVGGFGGWVSDIVQVDEYVVIGAPGTSF